MAKQTKKRTTTKSKKLKSINYLKWILICITVTLFLATIYHLPKWNFILL